MSITDKALPMLITVLLVMVVVVVAVWMAL